MPAYNKVYLDEIVETQGYLFELLPDLVPGIDMVDFVQRYMQSDTRRWVDEANPYVCTMNYDLLYEFLVEDGFVPKFSRECPDRIALNWIGQFYALYQWRYEVPSAELVRELPLAEMLRAYPGLHDLDLGLAVEKVYREGK